jgi:beta-lactamase regulating signal transducer with metallopeptidase domain
MQLWLNWLWQGTAITMLVACAVRARSINAATRERIWWITLIAVALIPMLQPAVGEGGGPISRADSPSFVLTVNLVSPSTVGAILAGLWASWTTLSLARLGIAWVGLRRARAFAAPFDRDRETRLTKWTALRDGGRASRLAVSGHVHRAAVLGWTRPMIALAPATLDRLTDEELDLVILHELAHVRRRDDIALVAQRLLTAFAGLHPAVWWLDRAITIEREAACDDWVVTCTGALKPYASSLVRLATTAGPDRCQLAPGAALSRSQLVIRIRRLLDQRRNRNAVRSSMAVWLAQIGITGAVAAGAAMPLIAVEVRGRASAPEEVRRLAARSISAAIRPEALQPSSIRAVSDALKPPAGMARAGSRIPRRTPPAPLPEMESPLHDAMPARPVAVQGPAPPQEADRLTDLRAVTAHPIAGALYEAPSAPARAAIQVDDPIWDHAAEAGVAIGRQSRAAAVAAASFFTRFGRSMASAF